jgi:hypothetical protein
MTNKVVLRSTDEFMSDYVPVYQPLYPLFMGKSQSYSEEVGAVNFKRVSAVGDIRAKHITPKDTEIQQIAVNDAKKTFKKYFLANQFIQSALQDQEGTEEVVAQVLDEHQKQADELLLLGEGTSASDMINNGLIWSNDPNYRLKGSAAISGTDPLIMLHSKVMSIVSEANQVAGRKAIIFYGATQLDKVNSLYAAQPVAFKTVLAQVLGANASIAEMPSAVTPANTNGFIVVNLDQVKLHYTTMPKLQDQGVNDEKMYAWFNFLMGSMMLEVLASGGIIRQPLTFS